MPSVKSVKPIRFYREKFLIACYDEDDDLITVCDNVYDLSIEFNFEWRYMASAICRIYRGDRNFFMNKGRKVYVHFIALTPAERAKYNALNQKAYQT